MLWSRSGFRLIICGSRKIYEYIKEVYLSPAASAVLIFILCRMFMTARLRCCIASMQTARNRFKNQFLSGEIWTLLPDQFDAGGSDRKVSAVIDGVPVFSDETVWNPKVNADPMYHYEGIVDSFKSAGRACRVSMRSAFLRPGFLSTTRRKSPRCS